MHPPFRKRVSTDLTQTYTSIYWSDGDSGRLGVLKFRLANIDALGTRFLKQRGGANCEAEREMGYNAFLVTFAKGKTLQIVRDYGEYRYGRLVIDLNANGEEVSTAGFNAGYLLSWPHKKGRAQSPKPDWCAQQARMTTQKRPPSRLSV